MVNKFLSKFTLKKGIFTGPEYVLSTEHLEFHVVFDEGMCFWWLIWGNGGERGKLQPLWSEEATVKAAYDTARSRLWAVAQEFSDAIDDA